MCLESVSKKIHITSLVDIVPSAQLPFLEGGEAFWLDSRTLAHVVTKGADQELYAVPLEYSSSAPVNLAKPVLIGTIPAASEATNFKFSPPSTLLFSATVYEDADVNTVAVQDEAWEQRGNSALIYDEVNVHC